MRSDSKSVKHLVLVGTCKGLWRQPPLRGGVPRQTTGTTSDHLNRYKELRPVTLYSHPDNP